MPSHADADALAAALPADRADAFGHTLNDADRRLFALREAGYTGPIDQDGYPADTADRVVSTRTGPATPAEGAPSRADADALAAALPADRADAFGHTLNDADRRLFALREAGYTGPINQDGYPDTGDMTHRRGEPTPGGGSGGRIPPQPPTPGGTAANPGDDRPSVVNIASGHDVIGVQAGTVTGKIHTNSAVQIGRVVSGKNLDADTRAVIDQAHQDAAKARRAAQQATTSDREAGNINVQADEARVGYQADTITGPITIHMPPRRRS